MPEILEDAGAASSLQFLTFRIDGRRYALPAHEVAVIIRVPPMSRVPQSPPALLGITNLGGAVLPVVSLRGLLGIEETQARASTRAVVLDIGSNVALVVDAVDSLIEISPERIESHQSELGMETGEKLKGTFLTGAEGEAAKILDIKGLLDTAFAKRASAAHRTARTVMAGTVAVVEEVKTAHEMLLTFEVAGQEFALDLTDVQEIIPAPKARTAIPKTETLVLGVTALRGTLLPLLSLRGLLGFPTAAKAASREKVVVLNVNGAQVGLVADAARAIVAAETHLVDPIPGVLASRAGGESRIRAIYRGDAGKRLISILAPEQLFREDVMQRLRAHHQRGESQLTAQAPAAEDNENFLIFQLGGDEFALPIDAVEEIAALPAQITRIPKTPKFLEGVVNLRGAVLPVIDLGRRFDMPLSTQAKGRRLVVVRTERRRAGLIVDGVSDVLRTSEAAIRGAPDLTDDIARLVSGVINLDASGRIVLVLSPPELLTRAERGILDKFQADQGRVVE
ncbi:chemotaxis protein CheW [Paraburkholderia metrosideri]|uniref:CheW-like domain-containing protein n=1 Tax=Paraburkholderia metrosideri TaxID=580937 RepID=A0ABN7HLH5_9BURK|nr:chemotaxis protein CheW [Paraburkholderia metrosideri]CAD6526084.1 hypothetical protein LMG28140_01798 [Paraburkholderia metrosideri]